MRVLVASTVALVAAAAAATSAMAVPANLSATAKRAGAVVTVADNQRRGRPRDCVPTNGPFGFYGNIWCEPPSRDQYVRNLGAGWPMKTPPSLRDPKPSSNYEW